MHERIDPASILRRFVHLCGGKRARIAVIPSASQLAETGSRYVEIFEELGVRGARSFPFESRQDGAREEWIDGRQRIAADQNAVFGEFGFNRIVVANEIGAGS